MPGLGIGAQGKGSFPPASSPRSPVTSTKPGNNAQLSELQSRFSRLSSSTSRQPSNPSEGTTFTQKQADFKTPQSLRNDPSSVSLNHDRNAASTANNFRERHGQQVKSGWQLANQFSDKVSSYESAGTAQNPEPASSAIEMRGDTVESSVSNGAPSAGIGKKKPPPPPPKKKADLGVSANVAPPPIPLGSKPQAPVSDRP